VNDLRSKRKTCPVCGGKDLSDGILSDAKGLGKIKHRVQTSIITSEWTEVTSRLCNECGYIMLFAHVESFNKPFS